jgi:hypothetical protein
MKKGVQEFEEFKNGNPGKRQQPNAVESQYSNTPPLHYPISPPTLAVLSTGPDAVKPHP